MKEPQTEKIRTFLEGIMLSAPRKHSIIRNLRDTVFEKHPKTTEKMMYGGILFSNEAEMLSGIFAYKEHISMEFSNGYSMKDPNRYLEGGGKFRRHLKFFNIDDTSKKNVSFFIDQAVYNYSFSSSLNSSSNPLDKIGNLHHVRGSTLKSSR